MFNILGFILKIAGLVLDISNVYATANTPDIPASSDNNHKGNKTGGGGPYSFKSSNTEPPQFNQVPRHQSA